MMFTTNTAIAIKISTEKIFKNRFVEQKLDGLDLIQQEQLIDWIQNGKLNIQLLPIEEITPLLKVLDSKITIPYSQGLIVLFLNTNDSIPPYSRENCFLEQLRNRIENHLDDTTYTIEHLAKAMAMSRQQLYRRTKALTGKSVAAYVRFIRLQHGKVLLKTTSMNVSEVAYQVGFSDPSYFSKTFSQEFGYAPSVGMRT